MDHGVLHAVVDGQYRSVCHCIDPWGLSPGKAFIAGLIGAGLAWGIMAGWIDIRNTGILSARIGQVFGGIPGFVLILITIAIGGLTTAAGALTGAMVRMNISGAPSKERP